MTNRKAKSPYQKKGKIPFRYSTLKGVAFQRHLVSLFGARYWIKVDGTGQPILNNSGRVQRMFDHEAYE